MDLSASAIAAKDRTDEKAGRAMVEVIDSSGRSIRLERSGWVEMTRGDPSCTPRLRLQWPVVYCITRVTKTLADDETPGKRDAFGSR